MPITDRLMTTGTWSLDLVDDAPKAVRDACATYWSQMYFTPTHDTGNAMSLATLRATAFYAGLVFRRHRGRRSFGGPGLLGFLITGQGAAGAYTPTAAPLTFAQILTDIFGAASGSANNGLHLGTAHFATATTVHDLSSTNGTMQTTYGAVSLKPMLDLWAKQTGNEYRVTTAGLIDYGVSTSLFNSTPAVLICPVLSGREGRYVALNVDQSSWDVAGDVDNYRNYAYMYDRTNTLIGSSIASGPPSVFGCVFDDPTVYVTMFGPNQQSDTRNQTDLDNQAAAAAFIYSTEHLTISVSVNEYCLWRYAVPGDWVDVYSLDDDVVDTTNPTPFQGEILHPKKMRLVGFTAPIMQGMGVYVVDGSMSTAGGTQAITDITDYVKWETGTTSLELDSLPARTTDIGRVSLIR